MYSSVSQISCAVESMWARAWHSSQVSLGLGEIFHSAEGAWSDFVTKQVGGENCKSAGGLQAKTSGHTCSISESLTMENCDLSMAHYYVLVVTCQLAHNNDTSSASWRHSFSETIFGASCNSASLELAFSSSIISILLADHSLVEQKHWHAQLNLRFLCRKYMTATSQWVLFLCPESHALNRCNLDHFCTLKLSSS